MQIQEMERAAEGREVFQMRIPVHPAEEGGDMSQMFGFFRIRRMRVRILQYDVDNQRRWERYLSEMRIDRIGGR